MNNRDLTDYLRDQYKIFREKNVDKYFEKRREAEKLAKAIIETFGDGIVDELYSRQKQIIDELEWNFR